MKVESAAENVEDKLRLGVSVLRCTGENSLEEEGVMREEENEIRTDHGLSFPHLFFSLAQSIVGRISS